MAEVTEAGDRLDREASVEFYNGVLIPDLVNAHCHLELSHMRGLIPPGGGFTAFARGMGSARGKVDPAKRAAAIAQADEALWRQGVGAVGDIANGDTTFAVKAASRIRYVTFLELFGLQTTSDVVLDPLRLQAQRYGLRASVTPHSTYSLNDAAFRSAVEAGGGEPLSIHFMESPAEAELFEGRGELAEWYVERGTPIDFAGYGSPAERIIASVPPTRNLLLVHNCCVTEEVVDRIEEHFAGRVTWVLCPRSNDYISHLTPPVGLLRRKGVRIAVGTDSLASNDSLDMVAELRQLGDVPLEELLTWATRGGAEALGLDDTLGGFEPGMRSGAVLLSGIDWANMRLTENSRTERIF